MHLEVSRVVKADPERVFAAYTDFESMPKWSKRLKSVRVTSREGDTVYLESEVVSSRGRERKTEGALKLTPPLRVESESETRFVKSRRMVAFEAVPEGGGTNLTATLDVSVKRPWGVFLRSSVKEEAAESSAGEELASFASYVEALTS